MTQIHDIDIQVPNRAGMDGYSVELIGLMGSPDEFKQLRELFSLADTTAVQIVPGRRPIGWDPTEDELNIWYVAWTHGVKPEDGWYLLRSFNTFEGESARGHSWYFIVNLLFLGSTEYLQDGYILKDLEVAESDWGL